MNKLFIQTLLQATGATHAKKVEQIQSLWSGYGEIVRYLLTESAMPTVVVKHVVLPDQAMHPRGWNTDRSHQRKITSYQVECSWYDYVRIHQAWPEEFPVAKSYGTYTSGHEFLMILEDLDANGFPVRKSNATLNDMKACLTWLAHFHAYFLSDSLVSDSSTSQITPTSLWPEGGYWHLETRPDEWNALNDQALKQAAHKLDRALKQCRFKTLLHGDAKLANFCFSDNETRVAAVDFQYTGFGCGMKDVAYFIGSCLDSDGCQQHAYALLDTYFLLLKKALSGYRPKFPMIELEQEWRALFEIAWADFHRFLKGWSPDHWKIHEFSEHLTQKAIGDIQSE